MKIIKKLFGLDKLEESIAKAEKDLIDANRRLEEAEKAANSAKDQEDLAKLTPKERASRKKEPWVGVLETHVNQDNIRNGFFELDWNDLFVLKLKQEGYGEEGDLDEEIVDRWFRELCANVVVDGDYGGPVNTGVIDINNVKRNNK
jgi:hypothetical protein